MNEAVIIITKSFTTDFKLLFFPNLSVAKSELKQMYLKEIKEIPIFDYNNTFISDDEKYAQVAFGLEHIEFRVGEVERLRDVS